MCEAIRFFDPCGGSGPQLHHVMYHEHSACDVEGEHGHVKLDRGARRTRPPVYARSSSTSVSLERHVES